MNLCPTKEERATVPRQFTRPRYEVKENADAFVVTALVPGVEREDIETTVQDESLSVVARRVAVPAEWTQLHRETPEADYRLEIALDRRVNRDAVTAELRQGVLTVTVPKAEDTKPRRIEIRG